MRPVLIVEGVAHKVRRVEYDDEGNVEGVSYFEDGEYKHVVDIQNQINLTSSDVMDLSKALIWNDRYQPIYEALDKVIADECKELEGAAVMYTETNDNRYQDEYKQLQQKLLGLIDAQELVSEFMVDDVDLSGGEDIATE